MAYPARQRFEFVEYVMLEELAAVKHEFLDGVVWAMAGGSPEHARVQVNVSSLLRQQLSGRPCAVYGSDLRVRVSATGLATYPDVTVVCGRLELDPDDPRQQTVVNPSLLVEVLSHSTEAYDRGEKLEHYRQIASLQAVMLVAHDERRIDVWTRSGSVWTVQVHRENAAITPFGCALALNDVYRDPLAQ